MTIDETNHMRLPTTSISFSNVEEFLLFHWATEKNKVKKDTIFDQNYDIFKPFYLLSRSFRRGSLRQTQGNYHLK